MGAEMEKVGRKLDEIGSSPTLSLCNKIESCFYSACMWARFYLFKYVECVGYFQGWISHWRYSWIFVVMK
jgi:hypothetical protein